MSEQLDLRADDMRRNLAGDYAWLQRLAGSQTRLIAEVAIRRALWFEARYRELFEAIADHRAQRADDRCVEDDDRLYEALGDGVKCDRRVGSKVEMLANCERFLTQRCEGGHWPSYAQLLAALRRVANAYAGDGDLHGPAEAAALLIEGIDAAGA